MVTDSNGGEDDEEIGRHDELSVDRASERQSSRRCVVSSRRSLLKVLGVSTGFSIGGGISLFAQQATAQSTSGQDTVSANVGPQPPVTISSYPYLETMQILYDGEPHDGVHIRVARGRLSESSYRVFFTVEQADSTAVRHLMGYGYSQILVVLSNVSIKGDELKASVDGGTPVGLAVGDVVYTLASGGLKDLVVRPIIELSKTVAEEVATEYITSNLHFDVPPDVETTNDVTVLRINFAEETLPQILSPQYFEQFELELPISIAEDGGKPSVSIIPDIRGSTIGQPTDNPITTTIGLPFEYRRQLLLTFPTPEQSSTGSSDESAGEESEDGSDNPGEDEEEGDTKIVWVPNQNSDSCSRMTVPADATPDPAFETEEACLEYDGRFGEQGDESPGSESSESEEDEEGAPDEEENTSPEPEEEEEGTKTVWVPDQGSDSCSRKTVPEDTYPDPAFETEEACLEYGGGFGS